MLPFGGWWEISLIALLSFVLLKPEDYRILLKSLGKIISKINFYNFKLQAYLESLAHEEDEKK